MIALLRVIPVWGWAIVALLALTGIQTYRAQSIRDDYARYRFTIEQAAAQASEQARTTEQKRQVEIEKVRTDALAQKAADDARNAELVATGNRLQQQLAQLLTDRIALRARLAARGKTIDDLTDLLAQLRREADDYAGELATALTASRRAGFACERSYDTLKAHP